MWLLRPNSPVIVSSPVEYIAVHITSSSSCAVQLQRLCGNEQVWSHSCTCMCLSQLTTTFPLTQVQAHTFELEEDTTSYGDYVKGGIVTEHKEHKTLDFKTLAQALDDPGEFLLSDFAKMERPGILHLGFQALNDFQVCSTCFDAKSELNVMFGAGSRHVHLFRTCPPVQSSINVTAGLYHSQHLGSLSISTDSLSTSRDSQSALYAKQQE